MTRTWNDGFDRLLLMWELDSTELTTPGADRRACPSQQHQKCRHRQIAMADRHQHQRRRRRGRPCTSDRSRRTIRWPSASSHTRRPAWCPPSAPLARCHRIRATLTKLLLEIMTLTGPRKVQLWLVPVGQGGSRAERAMPGAGGPHCPRIRPRHYDWRGPRMKGFQARNKLLRDRALVQSPHHLRR